MHFGKCYKIQWNKIHRGTEALFIFNIHVLNEKFAPKEALMFFLSNDSWHGIFTNEWPQFQPTILKIDLSKPYTETKMSTIEHRFQKGVENSSLCLEEMTKSFNCTFICSYLTFGSLPICRSGNEFLCNLKEMYKNSATDLLKCLSPRKALTFRMYSYSPYERKIGGKVISRNFIKFFATTKEVREELDVITTVQLIGNFGGSLGMFFGFSFAVPLIRFFNKVFNRFF